MSKYRSSLGFTLIEMMITILVIAILTILAAPSMSAMMRSNRLATQTNSFIASVSLARTEAIKNNFPATVCASTTGTACDSANWNTGWIVFDDVNGNGAVDAPVAPPAPSDSVIRFTSGTTDMAFSTVPGPGPFILTFDARGQYTGANLNFSLFPNTCPTGWMGVRNFTLLSVGQLTVTKANCP